MRVFERQNDCVITFHLHKSLKLGRLDPLLFARGCGYARLRCACVPRVKYDHVQVQKHTVMGIVKIQRILTGEYGVCVLGTTSFAPGRPLQ